MPVLTFHLVAGRHGPDQIRALVSACCHDYAKVLGSPVDRVRAFVRTYEPAFTFVAGAFADDVASPIGADDDLTAPFFEFIVLRGRPTEQRTRLLGAFTDHTVSCLGVRRELIRGRAIEVDPPDWAIGGAPASVTRATEIEAREAAR